VLGDTGCKSEQRVVASTVAAECRNTVGCKMNQAVFRWSSRLLRCTSKTPFQHETESVLVMVGVMIVGLWVSVEWALSARRTDAPLGGPQGEFPGLVFLCTLISHH
jgi:hypothetical protein